MSFPRVLRSAIFSTGIAHHIVAGSVARQITEPALIELRLCRLSANPFHTLRDLSVAHFVHPYMSRDSGGAGTQSPLQTMPLRAFRQAQEVQTAYMSATTVPYSSGTWVLFRSNVDSEV